MPRERVGRPQAKSSRRESSDAEKISADKGQQNIFKHAAAPPGLSVRIAALKKPAKGGLSFALLMDDISKQRHKRNPYSEKYLQLCLSSFLQVQHQMHDSGVINESDVLTNQLITRCIKIVYQCSGEAYINESGESSGCRGSCNKYACQS